MNKICKLSLITLLLFIVISISINAQSQGENIFSQQCASCHTIGRGDLVGPDLINVQKRRTKEWIARFINSPQEVINSGDSVANALFNKFRVVMPNHQYNTAEINFILAYIESKSSSAGNENSSAQTFGFTSISQADIEIGKNIFEGTKKLTNGGPACISCHNIDNPAIFNGGLLAKDLTTAYSRLSPAGIGGILSNPPFPAMADAFASKPLTKDEINYLLAFLSYTDNKGPLNATPLQIQFDLLIEIIVVLNIVFMVFLLLWQKVKKTSVNIYN